MGKGLELPQDYPLPATRGYNFYVHPASAGELRSRGTFLELEGILSEEERAQGFSLEEEEDLVFLLRYGRVLAAFSSHGVTLESIRAFLDGHRAERPETCAEENHTPGAPGVN